MGAVFSVQRTAAHKAGSQKPETCFAEMAGESRQIFTTLN